MGHLEAANGARNNERLAGRGKARRGKLALASEPTGSHKRLTRKEDKFMPTRDARCTPDDYTRLVASWVGLAHVGDLHPWARRALRATVERVSRAVVIVRAGAGREALAWTVVVMPDGRISYPRDTIMPGDVPGLDALVHEAWGQGR